MVMKYSVAKAALMPTVFLPSSATSAQWLVEVLTMAVLTRLEMHGPADELEKLKGSIAHLNPPWVSLEES